MTYEKRLSYVSAKSYVNSQSIVEEYTKNKKIYKMGNWPNCIELHLSVTLFLIDKEKHNIIKYLNTYWKDKDEDVEWHSNPINELILVILNIFWLLWEGFSYWLIFLYKLHSICFTQKRKIDCNLTNNCKY